MNKMNEREKDSQWYKMRSRQLGRLGEEPAAAKWRGFQGGLEDMMDNVK